jgi:RNA methyltransferase, TrmH family
MIEFFHRKDRCRKKKPLSFALKTRHCHHDSVYAARTSARRLFCCPGPVPEEGAMKCISRKDDPKILTIRQLIDQRPARERGRRFWCEGLRFVHHALSSAFTVHEVVAAPELFVGQMGWRLLDQARERGVRVTFVTRAVFNTLSESEECQGIGCISAPRWEPLESLEPERVYLAVDTMRSPGNLGTILRTAESLGAAGLVVVGETLDPFSPKVVRATMGALFALRYARTTEPELSAWRRSNHVALIGSSPQAQTDCRSFPWPGRCVLWLGGERKGMTEAQLLACDTVVKIPMAGQSDSLNVATAAAILLWEATRSLPGGERCAP